jgi:hypothetical protein
MYANKFVHSHLQCKIKIINDEKLTCLARLAGIEPTTPRLGIWCSILLSYKRTEFYT